MKDRSRNCAKRVPEIESVRGSQSPRDAHTAIPLPGQLLELLGQVDDDRRVGVLDEPG